MITLKKDFAKYYNILMFLEDGYYGAKKEYSFQLALETWLDFGIPRGEILVWCLTDSDRGDV